MIIAAILIAVLLILIVIINDNDRCRTYEHDGYDIIQELKRQEEKELDLGD